MKRENKIQKHAKHDALRERQIQMEGEHNWAGQYGHHFEPGEEETSEPAIHPNGHVSSPWFFFN